MESISKSSEGIEESMNKVTFHVTCTMPEKWADAFCSMLDLMENNGKLGHSAVIGFYSDGDGNYRPTFQIDREYHKGYCCRIENLIDEEKMPRPEVIFDADIDS